MKGQWTTIAAEEASQAKLNDFQGAHECIIVYLEQEGIDVRSTIALLNQTKVLIKFIELLSIA